jgi:hypothetical protein
MISRTTRDNDPFFSRQERMTIMDKSVYWLGFALDALIVIATTVLTILHIADLPVFIAVVGPMIGARLTTRKRMGGGNGPPSAGAGGASLVASMMLGLPFLFRRSVV